MSSSYFENRECPYYPCHNTEHINCLFCFCPLYFVDCPGNYSFTDGKKDCSKCIYPHDYRNYNRMVEKLSEEIERRKSDGRSDL